MNDGLGDGAVDVDVDVDVGADVAVAVAVAVADVAALVSASVCMSSFLCRTHILHAILASVPMAGCSRSCRACVWESAETPMSVS